MRLDSRHRSVLGFYSASQFGQYTLEKPTFDIRFLLYFTHTDQLLELEYSWVPVRVACLHRPPWFEVEPRSDGRVHPVLVFTPPWPSIHQTTYD